MSTTVFLIVGTIALLGFFGRKYLNRNRNFWADKGVPSIKLSEVAPWYNRFTLRISFSSLEKKIYTKFGDIKYGGYIELGRPVLYIKDLDLLKRILVKDFDHFVDRRTFHLNNQDKVMARMITVLTGKEWKDLRSVMSPTFTTGKIRRMFQFFNENGDQVAKYIKEESKRQDGLLNVQDCMGRYTLATIASIAFGIDINAFTNETPHFKKMAAKITNFSLWRVLNMITIMLAPRLAKLVGASMSEKEAIDFFDQVVSSNIKQRREGKDGGEKRQDFLQIMLEAQSGQLAANSTATSLDESEMSAYEKDSILVNEAEIRKNSNVILDDNTILAQSTLFFVAGADTLESALTFVFYSLALNPEVQEKLAEEVARGMEENQGRLTYDSVHGMEYLEMVLSESLRLNPPAFGTERQCTQDYTLPGTNVLIPKGTLVKIPITGIHHDEKHYENPWTFNPENFSAENKAKRHPYAFLPFGQGPRNCIAMRFAMTEAKAAIAHIVYNFKIEPCKKTEIPVKLSPRTSILKPKNGLWLRFVERERKN